jgi:hypothetical protein
MMNPFPLLNVKISYLADLDSSFGMIRANHPIPNTRKFYFEVEIIDAQGDGLVITFPRFLSLRSKLRTRAYQYCSTFSPSTVALS